MNSELMLGSLSLTALTPRRHGYDLVGPETDVRLHDFSPGTSRDDPRRAVVGQPSEAVFSRDAKLACVEKTIEHRYVPEPCLEQPVEPWRSAVGDHLTQNQASA